MQRINLIIISAMVLVIAGCAAPDTPRRSLSQLRTALLDRDADSALRYIDVDSITGHLAKDVLDRYATSDDPLTSLGVTVGRNMQPLLLPMVKEALRKQIRREITSEDSRYFGHIRRAHIFYLNVTMEGENSAYVEPKGKSDFAFRMAKTEQGYWKIVELILNNNEKK